MVIQRSLSQYRAGFAILDAVGVSAALLLAHLLRHGDLWAIDYAYFAAIPYTVLVFVLSFRAVGVYQAQRGGMREVLNLASGVAIGLAGTLALSFFYRGFSYSRLTAVYFAAFAFFIPLLLRYLYRAALDLVFGRSQWLKRVLVVGDSLDADRILEELVHNKSDFLPVGVLTRDGRQGGFSFGTAHTIPALGSVKDAQQLIAQTKPNLVILADREISDETQREIIELCIDKDIKWRVIPSIPGPLDETLDLAVVGGIPLLGTKGNNITGFNYVLKRAVDIVVATLLLILLSPVMVVVALLIKNYSKGPVFFFQERIGYRGLPFRFRKFRSMHVASDDGIHREFVAKWIADHDQSKLEDNGVVVHKITSDPRVIPVIGAFIRKFSIDELPQLFNVIKGDMSLVGPRPCLAYERELYQRWHRMRFDVLPGITGLWQVSGRNRLTFDQMVKLDIRYLQNWTLFLDLAIIARTPYIVLFDKAY
jgi:exopolysaccharide biosynthesis polyprenyl glycosylphosphotransferase